MIILDTCAFVWLAGIDTRLSEKADAYISNIDSNLFISAISMFEISMLSKKGRLILPLPPLQWALDIMKIYDIGDIPVSVEIASMSALLPPIHKDPCDRIIIATALKNKAPIISKDEIFPKYKDVQVIW